MGLETAIIGGLLAGGLFAMSQSKKNQSSYQNTGSLTQLQNTNAANAINTLPQAPEAPTGDSADAEKNAAETERSAQLAAMAENASAVNPTGGLGLTGQASTKKRTLGGGL